MVGREKGRGMERERKGGEWKEEGRRKVGERRGNLPPLKFRPGYATGIQWILSAEIACKGCVLS